MTRLVATVLLLLTAGALFAISEGDTVSVSVREGEVRSSPLFLSPIAERVGYGTSMTVQAVNGDWVQVRLDNGREGWIHSTSILPPEDMNLSGDTVDSSGASSREIALAGRGFNQQVEAEYQEQQDLDFAPVDRMERYVVPPTDLGTFLDEIDAEIAEEQDS